MAKPQDNRHLARGLDRGLDPPHPDYCGGHNHPHKVPSVDHRPSPPGDKADLRCPSPEPMGLQIDVEASDSSPAFRSERVTTAGVPHARVLRNAGAKLDQAKQEGKNRMCA